MKKIGIMVIIILLFSFLQIIWVPPFEVDADSSLSNLTIVSPQNKIYMSNFLTLKVTFNYVLAKVDSVSYSIDGSGRHSFSRRSNSEDSTIIHGTIIEVSALPELAEGPHTITVYLEGTLYFQGDDYTISHYSEQATVHFTINSTYVDTTPPVISGLAVENKTYNQLDLPLDFTIDEPVSWVGYSLDDEANVTLAGNTILTLEEGSHSMVLYANDTAGNMGKSDMVNFSIQAYPDVTLLSAASAVSIVIIAAILIGYLKHKKNISRIDKLGSHG